MIPTPHSAHQPVTPLMSQMAMAHDDGIRPTEKAWGLATAATEVCDRRFAAVPSFNIFNVSFNIFDLSFRIFNFSGEAAWP